MRSFALPGLNARNTFPVGCRWNEKKFELKNDSFDRIVDSETKTKQREFRKNPIKNL